MNEFWIYFTTGFDHIADIRGVDHILFIAALALRYQFADWRKLLVLVTAFTIGHSITLALSVFNWINYDTAWVEFLIPVTICITAISNVFVRQFSFQKRFPSIYFFALFFGLIHGMGFSSYLKSLLGSDESVVGQLLSFNLGLEAGQLIIVLAILIVTFFAIRLFKCNRRELILYITGGIFALSLQMIIERNPF